jgi:hypothetical protein
MRPTSVVFHRDQATEARLSGTSLVTGEVDRAGDSGEHEGGHRYSAASP